MNDKPPSNYKLISDINNYYEDLLGYSVEKTKLNSLNETQWNSFCNKYNLNKNSSGIYLPRNQTAIIPINNSLSLFHEYFGHGLYCEQSLSGRNLIDLENKLLKEEKQEFQNRQFSLEEIQKFREKNQTFKELREFENKNLGLYEGFAIFSEYFLSKEFNLKDSFEKNMNL